MAPTGLSLDTTAAQNAAAPSRMDMQSDVSGDISHTGKPQTDDPANMPSMSSLSPDHRASTFPIAPQSEQLVKMRSVPRRLARRLHDFTFARLRAVPDSREAESDVTDETESFLDRLCHGSSAAPSAFASFDFSYSKVMYQTGSECDDVLVLTCCLVGLLFLLTFFFRIARLTIVWLITIFTMVERNRQ
ncbi:hypothetical protein IWX90DRAFT_156497 [Phyllosticta citrichinensis]|uniref:Transmembrane protein n=1 Tax=Phyllosticta citrichinensis TaxID=1130410 RepID=A0ABR1Y082_9PEZI